MNIVLYKNKSRNILKCPGSYHLYSDTLKVTLFIYIFKLMNYFFLQSIVSRKLNAAKPDKSKACLAPALP